MVKLIIFDWDDVFTLGSKEGYFECYHQALVELAINLDPKEEHDRILAKWGQPYREELRELLKEKLELLDKACELYEKNYFGDVFVNHLKLVPGSIELLGRLKDKYKLAIATGSHPDILLKRVFPKFAIPNVFAHIITVHDLDDSRKAKPDPHMVQEILRRESLQPNEAVLVGDARNDVLMAQAAGVTPIVVLTGHLNKTEAEELGVEHIINDVSELETVLPK